MSENAMTPDYVVQRLQEAGCTLLALPEQQTRLAGAKSGWPDIVRAAVDAYGCNSASICVPPPDARAISRMDQAYGWLQLIPEDRHQHRRIVLMRSLIDPVSKRELWSWPKIGHALRWDHRAVQNWHAQAIKWIIDGLDDQPTRRKKSPKSAVPQGAPAALAGRRGTTSLAVKICTASPC